jgi:hypothetical protein
MILPIMMQHFLCIHWCYNFVLLTVGIYVFLTQFHRSREFLLSIWRNLCMHFL